jgi:hypothetical protein
MNKYGFKLKTEKRPNREFSLIETADDHTKKDSSRKGTSP